MKRLTGKKNPGLARKNHEFDLFFRLSLDMLCIADFEGFFKRLNPAWERTLGFGQHSVRRAFTNSFFFVWTNR